ncbi:dynobactin A family peptide antibiotic [Sodalis sp. dw_96]|uniref:dynobactin A family peptide antibiotic n=1 Tax=Sodalis sp. dw_96 TaxID=2719794 RepID=UPI001BD64A82|nr:dynobactin A family peptide antibiotic [Sodalis sp. dw_96]
MSDRNISTLHTWNKALIDCVKLTEDNVLKEGAKMDHEIIEKLVQASTVPSWNSNVHKYRC